MSSTTNNTFSGNNFVNNTNQIKIDDDFLEISDDKFASVNFWDNGTEGNYWSSYMGTDSNGDGVGDTAYVIDENNQDNYPHMSPYETSEDSNGYQTTPDLTLITVATFIGLPILVTVILYRRTRNT